MTAVESPAEPTSPVLHFVVPGPLEQRTGGYLYDARMVAGLRELGWQVHVHSVEGRFPDPDSLARSSLTRTLGGLPEGQWVIVDGLGLSALPEVAEGAAKRLRLLALVHHPLGDETGLAPDLRDRFLALERRTLEHVDGVVVTSRFTASRLEELGVAPARIRAVLPGTDRPSRVPPAPGREAPDGPVHLLCVGTVTPRKGQDLLVRALAELKDLPWVCTCAGSTERDPEFAGAVMKGVAEAGLETRVSFPGELDQEDLEAAYARAHLFVLPSWYEGFGMALTEALVRGLPVVSTRGGAIPWTVPEPAGVLVTPGSVAELTETLRRLIQDPNRRLELARAAIHAAGELPVWEEQVTVFADAVTTLLGAGRRTGEGTGPAEVPGRDVEVPANRGDDG